jgi:lysophospholipase L1-like esterase
MFAEQGADSSDFEAQARQAVNNGVDYVTVFLGHNDVCQNDLGDLPDIEVEFDPNIRAGLDILAGFDGEGLPAGAVIYIVGIVDIQKLWVAAETKKALGIIDCQVLWALSLLDLYPCASILNPILGPNEDAVILNGAINDKLSELAEKYSVTDTDHHYYYTDVIYETEIIDLYVSDIDCFHPSAEGQRVISELTWNTEDGPFAPPSP